MNNLERGRNLPSTPVLAALARELGVSTDLLLWGYGSADDPGSLQLSAEPAAVDSLTPSPSASLYPAAIAGMIPFRPRELQPDTALRARLEALATAFLALEDICGAMKQAELPLSIPFLREEDGIDRLVERVRTLLGVEEAVIFDYLELLENTGLRILFTELPESLQSVGLHDQVNSNVLFFIRAALNPERQLFRILYELGWAYQHVHRIVARVGDPRVLDQEHTARKFAARFLMPREAVVRTVRQLGITRDQWTYELLLRIKHRFGVSAQAFNLRLLELKLITPQRQQELRERIESHYAATDQAEPGSTKRVLSLNGRFGDLLLCAQQHHATGEVDAITQLAQGLPGV